MKCGRRASNPMAEDVERLSPLGYEHTHLLGRYTFALPQEIRQGAFHPLGLPLAFCERDLMCQITSKRSMNEGTSTQAALPP